MNFNKLNLILINWILKNWPQFGESFSSGKSERRYYGTHYITIQQTYYSMREIRAKCVRRRHVFAPLPVNCQIDERCLYTEFISRFSVVVAREKEKDRVRERLPIEIELGSFRASGSYIRVTPLLPKARRISLASRPAPSSASPIIHHSQHNRNFLSLLGFTLPPSVSIHTWSAGRVNSSRDRPILDPGIPIPRGIVATSRSRKGYELETCCPLLFPLTYIKGSMTECYIRAKDVCQRLSDRERARHAWVDRASRGALFFARSPTFGTASDWSVSILHR